MSKEYLDNNSLRDAVAQLFVIGLPQDYNTINHDSHYEKLIELNVGGVMLNSYNFPKNELQEQGADRAYNIIYTFIKKIKRDFKDDNVLIYGDFENYRYTSLPYPLTLPPSNLNLTAFNDVNASYYTGVYVGEQLTSVGFDVLLGPVLDVAYPVQGSHNTTLRNRTWGSDHSTVVNMASSYIDGLHKTGLGVIVKHFPGLGNISSNPHNSESEYTASRDVLDRDIKVFTYLADKYDGLMTSHVSIRGAKNKEPLTISVGLMNELLPDKKFGKKLIVSDDLSNMDSMRTVMEYRGLSYGDIALEAFSAGHDLLLFSHMSSNISSHSKFNLKDLSEAIDRIELYVSTSDGRRRLEVSLEKILRLKKMIREKTNSVSPDKFDVALHNIFDKTDYSDANDFVQSVFDGSIVLLSKNDSFQGFDLIEKLSAYGKLRIVGKKKYVDSLRRLSKRKSIDLIEKESYEGKGRVLLIDKYREKLASLLKESKVVFFADNKDDMEVVKYIYLYYSSLIDDLYVVVAESPDIIPDEFINQINMVVVFSQDARIGTSISKLLNGSIHARPISYMPMDISNGSYFDDKDRIPLSNVGDEPVQIFRSAGEQYMYEQMLQLRKHYWSLIFFIFLPLLVVFLILLYIVSAYYAAVHSEVKRRDVLKALNPVRWVYQHPLLTTLICGLFSLVILTVNPDSSIAKSVMKYQPQWMGDFIEQLVIKETKDVVDSRLDLGHPEYVSSELY